MPIHPRMLQVQNLRGGAAMCGMSLHVHRPYNTDSYMRFIFF
jgi:hypothetical protein